MIKNLIMNTFEKMLMIIVPTVGLTAIIYFLFLYLPDVQNGHFYDSSRLQGASSNYPNNNHSLKNTATSNHKERLSSDSSKFKKEQKTSMTDYIKWSEEDSVTFMPQSLKNRRYKDNASNVQSAANSKTINYQSKYNHPSKKPIKKQIKRKN